MWIKTIILSCCLLAVLAADEPRKKKEEPRGKRAPQYSLALAHSPLRLDRRISTAPQIPLYQSQFFPGPRSYSPLFKGRPQSLPAPPYAVPMEPLVHYSQRDPLYDTNSLSLNADGHNDLLTDNNHLTENVYGPPQKHVVERPVYIKEPEPIIEIIIKESNVTLPPPPAPPTPPPKKKEQVQVFYVKYKKNPNGHGKDAIIYDKPVAAISPPVEDEHEEPAPPQHHYEEVATAPPPPSTTLRTIIKPDSETYHSPSGVKVTFGKEGFDYDKRSNKPEELKQSSERIQFPQGRQLSAFPPSVPRRPAGPPVYSFTPPPNYRQPQPYRPLNPYRQQQSNFPRPSAQEYSTLPKFPPLSQSSKSSQYFSSPRPASSPFPQRQPVPYQPFDSLRQQQSVPFRPETHFPITQAPVQKPFANQFNQRPQGEAKRPQFPPYQQQQFPQKTQYQHTTKTSYQEQVQFPQRPQHQEPQFPPKSQYQQQQFPQKPQYQEQPQFPPKPQYQEQSNFPPKPQYQEQNQFPPKPKYQEQSQFPPKSQYQEQSQFPPKPQYQEQAQFPPKTQFQEQQFAQKPQLQQQFPPSQQFQQQFRQTPYQQLPQNQPSQQFSQGSVLPELIQSIPKYEQHISIPQTPNQYQTPQIQQSSIKLESDKNLQAQQTQYQYTEKPRQQTDQIQQQLREANALQESIRQSSPQFYNFNQQQFYQTTAKTSTTTTTTTTTTTPKPKTTTKDPKVLTAQLPDEVPDDLREQLLSSGILNNAQISILDYDKVGDIPLSALPPDQLANFYNAGGAQQLQAAGSAPIPAVADRVLESQESEIHEVAVKPEVEMKVVRYDPESDKGQKVQEDYVKEGATQVDPVVLNDEKYNRYLPLKISGTQFPIPDVPELKDKKITSVVVLAPVAYDFSSSRQTREATDEEIDLLEGQFLKELIKNPTKENFEKFLEKENQTKSEKQAVILLVTGQEEGAADKEIFMYDIATKTVNKLDGELSSAFVDAAEANAYQDTKTSPSNIIETRVPYTQDDESKTGDLP